MWKSEHIPSQVLEELEERRFLPLSGELCVGATLVQLPPVHSERQKPVSLGIKEGCRWKCKGHVWRYHVLAPFSPRDIYVVLACPEMFQFHRKYEESTIYLICVTVKFPLELLGDTKKMTLCDDFWKHSKQGVFSCDLLLPPWPLVTHGLMTSLLPGLSRAGHSSCLLRQTPQTIHIAGKKVLLEWRPGHYPQYLSRV